MRIARIKRVLLNYKYLNIEISDNNKLCHSLVKSMGWHFI